MATTSKARSPGQYTVTIVKFMAGYHGKQDIPDDIKIMRNWVMHNGFHKDGDLSGHVNGNKCRNHNRIVFNTSGKMKAGSGIPYFYMDLRLFSEEQWGTLTVQSKNKSERVPGSRYSEANARNGPHLGNVAGTKAEAVPAPPGYDYSADLILRPSQNAAPRNGSQNGGAAQPEVGEADVADEGNDEVKTAQKSVGLYNGLPGSERMATLVATAEAVTARQQRDLNRREVPRTGEWKYPDGSPAPAMTSYDRPRMPTPPPPREQKNWTERHAEFANSGRFRGPGSEKYDPQHEEDAE